jgi:hypothetical protein
MVYNTHNYWAVGLFPWSGILKTREENVSETGYVSVLRGGGRYLLCWVPFMANVVTFLVTRSSRKENRFD